MRLAGNGKRQDQQRTWIEVWSEDQRKDNDVCRDIQRNAGTFQPRLVSQAMVVITVLVSIQVRVTGVNGFQHDLPAPEVQRLHARMRWLSV